ncbi:uncharacterized protein SCODWIG_03819 [Saccharomycodes ludwigii]|uniref:Uncharacterized protein n=1 Tax=Saccharomycodes ludwigii TaxID=36035 RepID=A0A376BBQ4_9ASCO|nr:uncharacterized protein SCODWIG_03819 [Saccharomycodes ludwigii]
MAHPYTSNLSPEKEKEIADKIIQRAELARMTRQLKVGLSKVQSPKKAAIKQQQQMLMSKEFPLKRRKQDVNMINSKEVTKNYDHDYENNLSPLKKFKHFKRRNSGCTNDDVGTLNDYNNGTYNGINNNNNNSNNNNNNRSRVNSIVNISSNNSNDLPSFQFPPSTPKRNNGNKTTKTKKDQRNNNTVTGDGRVDHNSDNNSNNIEITDNNDNLDNEDDTQDLSDLGADLLMYLASSPYSTMKQPEYTNILNDNNNTNNNTNTIPMTPLRVDGNSKASTKMKKKEIKQNGTSSISDNIENTDDTEEEEERKEEKEKEKEKEATRVNYNNFMKNATPGGNNSNEFDSPSVYTQLMMSSPTRNAQLISTVPETPGMANTSNNNERKRNNSMNNNCGTTNNTTNNNNNNSNNIKTENNKINDNQNDNTSNNGTNKVFPAEDYKNNVKNGKNNISKNKNKNDTKEKDGNLPINDMISLSDTPNVKYNTMSNTTVTNTNTDGEASERSKRNNSIEDNNGTLLLPPKSTNTIVPVTTTTSINNKISKFASPKTPRTRFDTGLGVTSTSTGITPFLLKTPNFNMGDYMHNLFSPSPRITTSIMGNGIVPNAATSTVTSMALNTNSNNNVNNNSGINNNNSNGNNNNSINDTT